MSYNTHKFEQAPKGLSAIVASIKQIIYLPFDSFIIVLVMSCALFLAVASYILWKNIEGLYENWNISTEISVYLKKNVDAKKVEILVGKLKENKVVARIKLIDPGDGMKTFMAATELTALLSSFKNNPLPGVIIINPKIKLLSKDGVLEFIQALKSYVEVDIVKTDLDWLERSHHWINLLDKLVTFFIFILVLNALLILGGVSFAMSRVISDKHEVSKIVLQYQFAWYGLVSSLSVLLLTKIILIVLQDAGILLTGLSSGGAVFVVMISSLLSLISSRIATADL